MTQEQALEILKSGKNVFLTGAAGSGKTFVLNKYIQFLKENNVAVAVTASTGIASTHLGGITIHAWSGLGIRDYLSEDDIKQITKRGYLRQRYNRAEVIIIDEISMISRIHLDLIDRLFRAFKKRNRPFGGLQAVFCGDFFQLPPINAKEGKWLEETLPKLGGLFASQETVLIPEGDVKPKSYFAYNSNVWDELDLKICYLDEQHRQKDSHYLEVLNAIRSNSVNGRALSYLNGRLEAKIDGGLEATKLYTHNVDVDAENNRELEKINGKEYCYAMESIGPDALTGYLQKGCLAPQSLRLKVGARVMFVKNNFEEGYVNGTLGVVEKLEEERIFVRSNHGDLFDVGPANWMIQENGDIKAEIVQYPLRLAWAITIHKSQGMSLDAARVDLRQSFERGMGYVALSRVRDLDGLSLAGFNEMALRVDEEVLEFDGRSKKESDEYGKRFAKLSGKEKSLPPSKPSKGPKKNTVELTRELLEQGLPLYEIVKRRNLEALTIITHLEKIRSKDPLADFSGLVSDLGQKKLADLQAALARCRTEDGRFPLKPAKELVGDDVTYEELHIARLLMG